MSKSYTDISFSCKVHIVLAKMNSYLNTPVYSLISPSNIKYENRINQQLSLAAFSHKQKKKTMNSISTSRFLKEFGLIKLA